MAVSVKTGQMADVFHAICSVAMHPCVFFLPSLFTHRNYPINIPSFFPSPAPPPTPPLTNQPTNSSTPPTHPTNRNSSIPGGADRALSSAARLRTYITLSALIGGLSAGLVLAYRTLLRPGGPLGAWGGWGWGGLVGGWDGWGCGCGGEGTVAAGRTREESRVVGNSSGRVLGWVLRGWGWGLAARAPDRDMLMATRTFVRVSCGPTGFFLFLVAVSVVTPPIFPYITTTLLKEKDTFASMGNGDSSNTVRTGRRSRTGLLHVGKGATRQSGSHKRR